MLRRLQLRLIAFPTAEAARPSRLLDALQYHVLLAELDSRSGLGY
jgi:hypothetical protein